MMKPGRRADLFTRPRPTGGFSVVEVAISMAILAILMASIFSLLLSSQEVTLATSGSMSLDEEARQAIRLLRRDLRQSGWEKGSGAGAHLTSQAGVYVGNQLILPRPTDTVGDTLQGTAATSVLSTGTDTYLCLFRQRVSLASADANAEANNWTNDGSGDPAGLAYTAWMVVGDGKFRNVPGVINRYKLQRVVGTTVTPTQKQGAAIQNLESASFRRLDWNVVEVSLTFLKPGSSRSGGAAPEPSRRKIVELIRVNNRKSL